MEWTPLVSAASRTTIALLVSLLSARILTKQFVARLTYFDFVLGIMMGSLLAHIANDHKEPLWPVIIPALVLTVLGVAVGWLAMKYERIRHLLEGEPTVLIQNGKILEDNMRRIRYNQDQLNSQLRTSGIFDVAHVEFAMLEPGGRLSVMPKSQHRPVTPADLGIATRYEGMAIELIMDGKVVDKNLRENGLSRTWLEKCMHQRGIKDLSQVYYAVLNTKGEVFVDPYKDDLFRPVDVEGRNPSTPPSPRVP